VSNIDQLGQRCCVIGAGPSGLTAIKNLLQHGFEVDAFDAQADVGGNWLFGGPASSVYESTHLISSKRLTEFTDFSMGDQLPEYLSHAQALEYLRAYAREFGLYEHIEFGRKVKAAERIAEGGWRITLDTGEARDYAVLVIANGHNREPRFPSYPGEFTGQTLHSCEYKTADVLRGKRVLVVGAGNSGCDIAVDASRVAAKTFHSVRRGYYYLPKFLWGTPIDVRGERLLRARLPISVRRWLTKLVIRIILGRPEQFGLPKPDHKLYETHPIVNSQLIYHLGHGDIMPKPDVAELQGGQVRFVDGSAENVDLMICATGYKIVFPFMDQTLLNWQDGAPRLFLNVFHPQQDDLFVVGLIQPDSGQWGLTDYQCQLVAKYLLAKRTGSSAAAWFDGLKASDHYDAAAGIRYVKSPRHLLEVEHFSYREKLKSLIRQMERQLPVRAAS
jgi:cation diffusion facilitator CzcD-associated flavoprotein CzcO